MLALVAPSLGVLAVVAQPARPGLDIALEPAMSAVIQDAVVSIVIASVVLIAAEFVRRTVAHTRLHQPLANCRFRRRYRATRPVTDRTTLEAQPSPVALPVVRSPSPAGADE